MSLYLEFHSNRKATKAAKVNAPVFVVGSFLEKNDDFFFGYSFNERMMHHHHPFVHSINAFLQIITNHRNNNNHNEKPLNF